MEILLLTTAAQPTTEVLPALGLLGHRVAVSEFDVSPLLAGNPDAVLVDGRFNLADARAGCSPARTCCRRSGATTTSAAPGPWTCTCAGCGPSSVRSSRP